MLKTIFSATTILALLTTSGVAIAAQCETVRFSDVGWTDITTTTSAARQVLEALGYKVDVSVLSVPVTYASLASDDIDVFLGNWMPSQVSMLTPYLDSGEIETIATNLTGTKYTLAVPSYTYDKGLTDYSKIAQFGADLDNRIYAIEPGNEANDYLLSLVAADKLSLGKFKIVESSEQGMLAEVTRDIAAKKDVVFLGWEPHPMNSNFSLKYLTGGEDFFGGDGVVNTVTRKGLAAECPNVGTFLKNLKFSLPMENQIMDRILNAGEEADAATLTWMKANPDVVLGWIAGVTALDGSDGAAALKKNLGL